MDDRRHLLAHVVVTVLLGVVMLGATWLCLFNGAL
jgi:hypothetical protein